MKQIQPLPTAQELHESLPLNGSLSLLFQQRQNSLLSVLKPDSGKLLLLVGPCSADNEDAVLRYAELLAKLQDKVADKLLLVPRLFTAKPRRDSNAYRGLIHQPYADGREDMAVGLYAARRLHLRVAQETGLFGADEMLYPETTEYLDDLVSYWVIGARSSENQQHRLVGSGLTVPVGIKNPMSGNLNSLLEAVATVSTPHRFMLNGSEWQSSGNRLAHCILRGYVDVNGVAHANCDRQSIEYIQAAQQKVIVDCNHHNSGKNYRLQPHIAMQTLAMRDLKPTIRGLMIESYLVGGRQQESAVFGQSLTDGCLGWAQTERLIQDIADNI